MTGVSAHLIVFLVVNALLVAVWGMTGTVEQFWPRWVLVPWGALLLLHLGLARLFTRARRRRRGRGRQGRQAGDEGTSWIAAMFVDMVGSTALAGQLGDRDWVALVSSYRRVAESVCGSHGGTIIGTQGDGLLVRFTTPADAVRAAGALQRRFARDRDAGQRMPPVRIGIHAGQAHDVKGDVLGQMVNIAARITDTAAPDEVVVSEPVADHAPPDAGFDDRGLRTLRGAGAPRHLLALRWRGYD